MSTTLVFAAVGAKALLYLYVWLASAAISAQLSRSKGYQEKPGLGTGLLLPVIGPILWLFIPPKDETAEWNHRKPWHRRPKAADLLGLSVDDDIKPGATAAQPGEGAGPAAVSEVGTGETAPPAAAETDDETGTGADTADGDDAGAGSRPGESRDL